MKKNSQKFNIFYLGIALIFIVLFDSCSPTKNVVYFQNLQKDTILSNVINNSQQLKIRKNDLLSIAIISPDPLSTPLFNSSTVGSTSSAASGSGSGSSGGYLVDHNGNISIYKLGEIKAEGLTRAELMNKLQKELIPYLKDAVITVRFLNNRVTLLGEVARPGTVPMINDEMTIIEAIGLSGDLTFTGRRDNILVIREMETGKQFQRLNLNDKSIFYSPFYYLRPDDIVYIEPTEAKIKSTSQNQQYIGYILTGVSILITILSLLIR